MKKLFFILLLVNSIYFIWHLTLGSSRSLDQRGNKYAFAKQGDEAIVLVKELASSRVGKGPTVLDSKQKSDESKNSGRDPDPTKTRFDVALLSARKTGQSRTKRGRAGTMKSQSRARSKNNSIGFDVNRTSRFDKKTPADLGGLAMRRGGSRAKQDGRELSLPRATEKSDQNLASSTRFLGRKTIPECYKLGPFSDKEPVEELTVDLAGIASWFRIVSDPTDVQTGFWVLFPPGDNFKASRANYEILKSLGIEDIWLFTNGELRGFISLGLFVLESDAAKELARFEEMGIEAAELRPWTVKEYKHWLLFVTGEAHGIVMKRVRKTTDITDAVGLTTTDNCQQLVEYQDQN